MDVMDAIMSRRSIRKYKSTPIPEEDLNAILEAPGRKPMTECASYEKYGQRLKPS